jgi:hypothetical protein
MGIGDNVANDLADRFLGDPDIRASLKNSHQITADVASVTGPLAALIRGFLPAASAQLPSKRIVPMSTGTSSADPIDTSAPFLGPVYQTAVHAQALSATRQYQGVRAAIALRLAFRNPDFADSFFSGAALHMAANGATVLPTGQIDESDGTTAALGQPGHPMLQNLFKWLQNGGLQWILNVVTMLLPMFGGPTLPPITLPPIPKPTSEHVAARSEERMTTDFALPVVPPGVLALLADFGAAELKFIQGWIGEKLAGS